MGIPKEGEFVTTQSYKHDGYLHRAWCDTMVLETSEYSLIGMNDYTPATEFGGYRQVIRELAIVYFHKKCWLSVIAMIREEGVSYYCNLASPYVLDDETLRYIDHDLDIKVFSDDEKHLSDIDEYEFHNKPMDYPKDINFILKENVKALVDRINNEKGLFSSEHINTWCQRYQQLPRKQPI